MKKRLFSTVLAFLLFSSLQGQVIVFLSSGLIGAAMPEHGFLPGKKFQYYPTIDKYDFQDKKLRVELFDDRDSLRLNRVNCSNVLFTNSSEFVTPNYINKIRTYFDTLFTQSGIVIDSSSKDVLQVRFEAFDVRLIGFFSVRAHGLCQMKMNYRGKTKTYCIDITDADKNSPISPNAFVNRQTGTRIIASAAIREIIEQFLVDFKSY